MTQSDDNTSLVAHLESYVKVKSARLANGQSLSIDLISTIGTWHLQIEKLEDASVVTKITSNAFNLQDDEAATSNDTANARPTKRLRRDAANGSSQNLETSSSQRRIGVKIVKAPMKCATRKVTSDVPSIKRRAKTSNLSPNITNPAALSNVSDNLCQDAEELIETSIDSNNLRREAKNPDEPIDQEALIDQRENLGQSPPHAVKQTAQGDDTMRQDDVDATDNRVQVVNHTTRSLPDTLSQANAESQASGPASLVRQTLRDQLKSEIGPVALLNMIYKGLFGYVKVNNSAANNMVMDLNNVDDQSFQRFNQYLDRLATDEVAAKSKKYCLEAFAQSIFEKHVAYVMEARVINRTMAKRDIQKEMAASILVADPNSNTSYGPALEIRAMNTVRRKLRHWVKYEKLSKSLGWTAYFFLTQTNLLGTLVEVWSDQAMRRFCHIATVHRTRLEHISHLKGFDFDDIFNRIFGDLQSWAAMDYPERQTKTSSDDKVLYHTVVEDDYSLTPLDNVYTFVETSTVSTDFVKDPRTIFVENLQRVCQCEDPCICTLILPPPPIEIFRTKDRGLGIRAVTSIMKGQVLGVYHGMIKKMSSECANLVYAANGHLSKHPQDYIVDAAQLGTWTRLMNHSCDPNCQSGWHDVDGIAQLILSARRDIESGTELAWNYGTSYWKEIPYECCCGSINCMSLKP